jgi:hypothetical protein
VICLYCGATEGLTITGERRCAEFWPCWERYTERCDREDAAKRAALTAATGTPGAEVAR